MPTTPPGLDVTIDVTGLEKTISDLDLIDEYTLNEATITMDRVTDVVLNAVAARTPVNLGPLRLAWGKRVKRGLRVVKGTVTNPLDYVQAIEHGWHSETGKWPPRDAIQLWVERKLQIQPPESERVAFLIQRKIGTEGTEGAHMAEEGLASVRSIIEADLLGIPGRVADRVNRQ